jgi:dCTP deaminase
MGVKSDRWITRMAMEANMIEPFQAEQVSKGQISFGVSSYGYDMRLGRKFEIFRGAGQTVLDPKQVDTNQFEAIEGESCLVPNGSFVLGRSMEYFRIPRDVLTICSGKSTYARCGVLVNVTPFEPEWEGYVTLSISNTGPCPVRLYAEEGIAQVIFLGAESVCETSYADKKGKYQSQQGIAHALVRKAIEED